MNNFDEFLRAKIACCQKRRWKHVYRWKLFIYGIHFLVFKFNLFNRKKEGGRERTKDRKRRREKRRANREMTVYFKDIFYLNL